MKRDSHNDIPEASLSPIARAFLWVESPAAVRRAIAILAGLCAVLFVADFVIHRHAYAPYEHVPGFYALTGFLAFCFVIFTATALRWLIKRSETYYAPHSVDAEHYPAEGLDKQQHPGAPPLPNDAESQS